MADIVPLAIVALVMISVSAIFARYPATAWFEQRLPWLFPRGMTRHLEAIACDRPVNYFAIHFLMLLGAFVVLQDLGLGTLGWFARYSVAALVACFALSMARRSALQRSGREAT